nr:hypothetical protein [Tanacetum cinerariifolium]
MCDASSTVTYTSVYTDSEPWRYYGEDSAETGPPRVIDLEEDPEEDPEDDQTDYPTDGGDGDDEPSDGNEDDTDDEDPEEEPFEENDEEEEEHPTLADSPVVPTIDLALSDREEFTACLVAQYPHHLSHEGSHSCE